jgi:rhodanese-related sulfurtransferase
MIPRLLTTGFRALSMAPPLIPSAKERIRSLRLEPEPNGAASSVPRIEAAELRTRLASGQPITVLDARSPEAWNASRVRIPGATHLEGDEVRVDPSWPRDRLTVVYCTCPGDAGAAAVAGELRNRGFSRTAVLDGGFAAWEAAGGPVEGK